MASVLDTPETADQTPLNRWPIYALLLALVFLSALPDTPGGVARQSLTPDLAKLAGVLIATIPLGIVITSFAIELVGLRTTLVGLAVAYLVMAATTFVNPAFRRLER